MRFPVALLMMLAIPGAASVPVHSAPPHDPVAERANEAVIRALAAGGDVPGQARNLVELAWPSAKRDEAVSLRARRQLVDFGEQAIAPLRKALNTVRPEYTEEVLATTLGAQRLGAAVNSQDYLASVIDAFWVGSHGAKVLAIQTISSNQTPMAVGPMIDSAIDDPTLAPQVVEALGTMHFQQARFYLEKVMMEGPSDLRPVAASSLAQIGGAALLPLRNALKAPNREARLLAARALLPVATEYDLGAIYEYLEKHGSDDPTLTQELKALSVAIEKAIAARDASAAAASPQNF